MAVTTAGRAGRITAGRDVGRLDALARAAHETSAALGDAFVSLRNAIDRAPYGEAGEAETFAALRHLQTALDDIDRRAGAVISHAVTCHGYY